MYIEASVATLSQSGWVTDRPETKARSQPEWRSPDSSRRAEAAPTDRDPQRTARLSPLRQKARPRASWCGRCLSAVLDGHKLIMRRIVKSLRSCGHLCGEVGDRDCALWHHDITTPRVSSSPGAIYSEAADPESSVERRKQAAHTFGNGSTLDGHCSGRLRARRGSLRLLALQQFR